MIGPNVYLTPMIVLRKAMPVPMSDLLVCSLTTKEHLSSSEDVGERARGQAGGVRDIAENEPRVRSPMDPQKAYRSAHRAGCGTSCFLERDCCFPFS